MKIAISVPEETFKASEKLAKRMRISRSKLYVLAVERMIAEKDQAALVAKLNKIYSAVDTKPDEHMRAATRRVLDRSKW